LTSTGIAALVITAVTVEKPSAVPRVMVTLIP
jgi:hypothetical protein